MLRGAALAALCAVAGAGAWLAIAWYAGGERSLVAWAVGLATGVGMLVGRHRASRSAGLVAALLAAGGIIVGKILVFVYVEAPLFIVLALLMHQELLKAGIDPAAAPPSAQQVSVAREKAQTRLRAMSSAERREQIRVVVEARKPSGGVLAELNLDRRIRRFFNTMFAPIDALMIVLAIATAFKIATLGGAGGA